MLNYLLTYSKEQSPPLETNWFSASQEIPLIVWNLNVCYHIYKGLPPVPVLRQMNPVHGVLPTSWRSILILSSHLHLGLSSDSTLRFPHYNPVSTSPPIRATCPAHLILLDLITWIIFGEEYRSLSTSLFSFLHSLLSLRHKYSSKHPILKYPQLMFLPQSEWQTKEWNWDIDSYVVAFREVWDICGGISWSMGHVVAFREVWDIFQNCLK